jgi:Domain of unknown function (DUF1508)
MSGRPNRLEVYGDDAGEWRWRLKAGNGRTIADAEEGFSRRAYALRKGKVAAMGAGRPYRLEVDDEDQGLYTAAGEPIEGEGYSYTPPA